MFFGISHLVLPVTQLEQSTSLWRDIMGFAEVQRGEGHVDASVDALLQRLHGIAETGDTVVFMSNGGFEGAPRRFVDTLHANPS